MLLTSLVSSSNHRHDRSLLPIIFCVLILHGFFLTFSFLTHSTVKKMPSPPPPRLVVQTISLSPQKIIATTVAKELPVEKIIPQSEPEIKEPPEPKAIEVKPPQPKEPEPKAPEVKPAEPKKEPLKAVPAAPKPAPPPPKKQAPSKPAAPPKKTPTKATPAKKEPPKKTTPPPPPTKPAPTPPKKVEKVEKPSPPQPSEADKAAEALKKQQEAEKEAARVRRQTLLAKAQESIAKIPGAGDKISLGKSINEIDHATLPITSLQVDALPVGSSVQLSDREVSYRDELASRLKLLLRLPEYGEVKIKLTIARSGKIAKVVVVSSESGANRKYIEKTLPELTFPQFGNRFGDADDYTFSVTLGNE